jgi:hypothetical protein
VQIASRKSYGATLIGRCITSSAARIPKASRQDLGDFHYLWRKNGIRQERLDLHIDTRTGKV